MRPAGGVHQYLPYLPTYVVTLGKVRTSTYGGLRMYSRPAPVGKLIALVLYPTKAVAKPFPRPALQGLLLASTHSKACLCLFMLSMPGVSAPACCRWWSVFHLMFLFHEAWRYLPTLFTYGMYMTYLLTIQRAVASTYEYS